MSIVALLLAACPGDDDQGDSATGDTTGDTTDGMTCTEAEACEVMLATGFFFDEQTCLDWFASEGSEDPACTDFQGFYSCACECTGMSPANAEVCLGQCNQNNCA